MAPPNEKAAANLKKCSAAPMPHPLLAHIPPLTIHEREQLEARVRREGQREPIEVYQGQIIAGVYEYAACIATGTEPRLTQVEPKGDLTDYMMSRNLPRTMTAIDRAAIACLVYRPIFKEQLKDKITLGRKSTEGERWYEHAARACNVCKTNGDVCPNLVKRLASIMDEDMPVFEAVRSGKIAVMSDAIALVQELRWDHGTTVQKAAMALQRKAASSLKNPDAKADRAEVLKRYEASKRKTPIKALIYDVKRAKRIKRLPAPTPKGKDWAVYAGDMDEQADNVTSASVDLVVADIIYGEAVAPGMAAQVARIAKAKLVEGGVLALMAGHVAIPEVIAAVRGTGMHFLTMGFISYEGGSGEGLRGKIVDRVDCDPVLFFSSTNFPKRRLTHLRFNSRRLEKDLFTWQKSTDAMISLVVSAAGRGGVVLDPCCGSGTTLEAALRTGNKAVGFELHPDRAKIAQARMVEVEEQLRSEAANDLTRVIQAANDSAYDDYQTRTSGKEGKKGKR